MTLHHRTFVSVLRMTSTLCGWRYIAPAIIALTLSSPVMAGSWGGSLGATTDYVFRGLTQSAHDPSLQADLHYSANAGWFVGLWAANVKRDSNATTAEINAYLGYAWPVTDTWTARLSAVHYAYPSKSPRRLYDYDDLAGTLAYRNRISLTVAVSPNTSSESTQGQVIDRTAYAYELAAHQPLLDALSLNAGLGYHDLQKLYGKGYAYWNAGLSYNFGPAQLDLSYIGTDNTAKALFTDKVATNRWVATLLWRY